MMRQSDQFIGGGSPAAMSFGGLPHPDDSWLHPTDGHATAALQTTLSAQAEYVLMVQANEPGPAALSLAGNTGRVTFQHRAERGINIIRFVPSEGMDRTAGFDPGEATSVTISGETIRRAALFLRGERIA